MITRLDLHYGDEKNLFAKGPNAQIAGTILMRGTQKHTRQQIQDELDKLKAQMTASASVSGANFSINTVRAGFPNTLRLAAEVMRQPAFPETRIEQIRQSLIGRIEAARNEPRVIDA